MSEIRDRDEFILTVNRLMICAMEDIDCGRDEAGPTTLDLVGRIERHDAALRAALAEAVGVIRRITENHAARLTERGILVYGKPVANTGFVEALEFLASLDGGKP